MKTRAFSWAKLAFLPLLAFLLSTTGFSQNDLSCADNGSNDVNIAKVYIGDALGNEINLSGTSNGSVVNGYLYITFSKAPSFSGFVFTGTVSSTSGGTSTLTAISSATYTSTVVGNVITGANSSTLAINYNYQLAEIQFVAGHSYTIGKVFIGWVASTNAYNIYASDGYKIICSSWHPKYYFYQNLSYNIEYCAPIAPNSPQVCVGSTLMLTAANSATKTWSSLSPSNASINATTGQVLGLSAGNAIIQYTTAACTVTTTVVVSSPPVVNITSGVFTNTCAGSAVTVNATGSGPINWTVTGGIGSLNTPTGNSVVFTPTGTGVATLTASVNGTGGCIGSVASATYVITVLEAPSVTLSAGNSTTTCSDAAVTVGGVSHSGGTIAWTVQSG
ncbi:MAG: hypothetical protein ACO1OO_11890, partial [Flavisolibacter sp.]